MVMEVVMQEVRGMACHVVVAATSRETHSWRRETASATVSDTQAYACSQRVGGNSSVRGHAACAGAWQQVFIVRCRES